MSGFVVLGPRSSAHPGLLAAREVERQIWPGSNSVSSMRFICLPFILSWQRKGMECKRNGVPCLSATLLFSFASHVSFLSITFLPELDRRSPQLQIVQKEASRLILPQTCSHQDIANNANKVRFAKRFAPLAV